MKQTKKMMEKLTREKKKLQYSNQLGQTRVRLGLELTLNCFEIQIIIIVDIYLS